MIDVGQRILELLEEKHMSQYMLAKKSGLKTSTINTIIRKTQSPKLSHIEKICNGFGITVGCFLKEENERSFCNCPDKEKCFKEIETLLFKP